MEVTKFGERSVKARLSITVKNSKDVVTFMKNSVEYLNLNNETFYNLKDICDAFGLKYNMVKQTISNKYISLKNENSNSYDVFVNSKTIYEFSTYYKQQQLKYFANTAIRNAFGEHMYDRENNHIVLNM